MAIGVSKVLQNVIDGKSSATFILAIAMVPYSSPYAYG